MSRARRRRLYRQRRRARIARREWRFRGFRATDYFVPDPAQPKGSGGFWWVGPLIVLRPAPTPHDR